MQVRQAACRQDVLPIQRRSSQPERIHIEGRLRSQRILILAATLDGVVGTGQPNALIRGAQQVGPEFCVEVVQLGLSGRIPRLLKEVSCDDVLATPVRKPAQRVARPRLLLGIEPRLAPVRSRDTLPPELLPCRSPGTGS